MTRIIRVELCDECPHAYQQIPKIRQISPINLRERPWGPHSNKQRIGLPQVRLPADLGAWLDQERKMPLVDYTIAARP